MKRTPGRRWSFRRKKGRLANYWPRLRVIRPSSRTAWGGFCKRRAVMSIFAVACALCWSKYMQIPLNQDMVRLWMRSAGREVVIDAVFEETERHRGGVTQTEYFRRLSAAPRRGAQFADEGGRKRPGQEQVRGLWEKILKAKT